MSFGETMFRRQLFLLLTSRRTLPLRVAGRIVYFGASIAFLRLRSLYVKTRDSMASRDAVLRQYADGVTIEAMSRRAVSDGGYPEEEYGRMVEWGRGFVAGSRRIAMLRGSSV